MIQFFKSLYINSRLYYYLSCIAIIFLISNWFDSVYMLAILGCLILAAALIFDAIILFRFKKPMNAIRILPEKLSNSDDNSIVVVLENLYPFDVILNVIDEIPEQFQKRDFYKVLSLISGEKKTFEYDLKPTERGEYHFGSLNVYTSSRLQILKRRHQFAQNAMVPVYPSYIQMKKYEFLAMSNRLTEFGMKKIRRIGHTMEFEQIKEYVIGDDVRTINWKATAKRGDLMVNQYQDEKSQPIYSIIDIGRVMKMPFEELKLIDYAINSTLAFSNIALLKNDKAGMMTFSKNVENIVLASNKKTNLSTINEVLYNIDTNFSDSDFSLLYGMINRKINHRSLLILYTNFEHISALQRQLPYLKSLAKKHLLLVVFFENTELNELIESNAEDLQSVYEKTIAQKFSYEKRMMVKELESYGVNAILTKPKSLSVNVINKYLEFKSRGMI